MEEENWKKTIQDTKKQYKKIGHIECPAFANEKVYFRSRGFNHLIAKDRKYRSKEQQVRRLGLIHYASDILRCATKFNGSRIMSKQFKTINGWRTSVAHFWSFDRKVGNKVISVVVCQINNEPKQFISVVDEEIKHKSPRRDSVNSLPPAVMPIEPS